MRACATWSPAHLRPPPATAADARRRASVPRGLSRLSSAASAPPQAGRRPDRGQLRRVESPAEAEADVVPRLADAADRRQGRGSRRRDPRGLRASSAGCIGEMRARRGFVLRVRARGLGRPHSTSSATASTSAASGPRSSRRPTARCSGSFAGGTSAPSPNETRLAPAHRGSIEMSRTAPASSGEPRIRCASAPAC